MGGTSDFKRCITHGPWGSSEGTKWVYMPQGFIKKTKIIVEHGDFVYSISFRTNFSKGEPQNSFFGYADDGDTNTICIDHPTEYLISISGTYGTMTTFSNNLVITGERLTSICFMTNLNLYGPYGSNLGTFFSYDVKDGVVVGFHGRVNRYPSAIGVYLMPESLASVTNSTYEHNVMPELCSSTSVTAMPRDAGPWGACGGKPWDDGVFSTIKQVYVHVGELNLIYALQFQYLKSNAKFILSQVHGVTGGSKIQQVSLGGKDEYLTGISGFYGPVKGYNGLEALVSITFHSNRRIHGPYGEESGTGYVSFRSTASSGKVVGFHGRNNGFLSAIGVHMEYFSEDDNLKAVWT